MTAKYCSNTGCPQRDSTECKEYVGAPNVNPRDRKERTGAHLLERILQRDNLNRAYLQVERNHGAPGIDGMTVEEAKVRIKDYLEETGIGHRKVNYKLRDWVFARQRYWGEPIPIVHCEKCGYVPIDESELPLVLPQVDSYEPTDNGESPLSKMTDWVNTTCPKCGGKAMRETDTMPQWAGSSWYFLRYMDPHNDESFASKEALNYWHQVDWYNGGMEHTTLHLLYSRFWHKFLYDIGQVPTAEPYAKRTSHGMILGENGEKMSKSRGNVVNPDDVVNEFGADTLRLYECSSATLRRPHRGATPASRAAAASLSVIGICSPFSSTAKRSARRWKILSTKPSRRFLMTLRTSSSTLPLQL